MFALEYAIDEPGIEVAGLKVFVSEDAAQEWQGRLDRLDLELLQTSLHAAYALAPGGLMRNHFRDQRVVVR